jgi:hypothetical protein
METRQDYQEQLPFRFHVSVSAHSDDFSGPELGSLLGRPDAKTSSRKSSTSDFKNIPLQLEGLDCRSRAFFRIEPNPLEEPLDSVLGRLASHLEAYTDGINEILEGDARITASIVLYPGSALESPFDYQIIDRIRQIGIDVHLDISRRHETIRAVPKPNF